MPRQLFHELSDEWRQEIGEWSRNHGLTPLAVKLTAHTDQKTFLDSVAEAIVARHMLRRGCDLLADVPTPLGRTCDLEVTRDGQTIYLHVKRADTVSPPQRRLTISSRLRYLERIRRPYVVAVRWAAPLTDEQMQLFVTRAGAFIQRASVGDELVIRDDADRELGGVMIVAPWEGAHVTLTIGLPEGFIDQAPRFKRLMRRGYRQFMPRAVNVVVVCSANVEDVDDFDAALRGSHIERWDAQPPQGRRIAHGRARDGFWAGRQNADSQAAAWMQFEPDADRPASRLWLRSPLRLEPEDTALLTNLFES